MSLENYEERLTTGYYRVRKAWEDDESQIGQYRLLASAVKKADENPGHSVFTPAGIAIYPEDEETVDEPEAVQDEPEAVREEAETGDNGATVAEAADEPISTAEDEAPSPYPNDGNTEPILYAKANTLLNVRAGNSIDSDKVTVIRKNTIVEVLQECDNGWLRIKSENTRCGYAYVSGEYLTVGSSLYTVQPADSLWKIAEKTLNNGTKYTEIKKVNNLTSNVIRVGMVLLIP